MRFSRPRPAAARFLKSVPNWRPGDDDGRPQVAVGGRSNVGKSSLINRLLGRKGLARTSNTPGRTQALNYFEVGPEFVMVDLPGHGYAKAPLAVVRQWQENTRRYLLGAADLVGVVLLLDLRRDPTAADRELLSLARQGGREVAVVLTKADKMGRGQRGRRVQALARALECERDLLLVTSAHTGEGVDAVWDALGGWLAATAPGEEPAC
jgi:GTP-binding protein